MLVIYKKGSNEVLLPQQTSFSAHNILERQHIEKWIENYPEILGEDLLILTTEYDKFDKTSERLDILALDRNGTLVVIELKRDDSGKNVDIQAIKYAAYCSTLTFEDVVEIYKAYLYNSGTVKSSEEVRAILLDFISDSEFEQIGERPRIIIVSNNYRTEVTASVLWLRKFGIDIKCVRLVPYSIDDNTLGLEATTIIPLPEAEEFIIKAERKENTNTTPTVTQNEYVEFYSELVERIKTKLNINLSKPMPRAYYQIPVRVNGVHLEWGFHGRPRNSFGVELHFESSKKDLNLQQLGEFIKLKDTLETAVGETMLIQNNWGKNWSRVYFEKPEGKVTEELKEWAVNTMVKFYNVVIPYFQPKV